MRNRIFGALGVIWGGYVLVGTFQNGLNWGDEPAYNFGLACGQGLMLLMFVAGLYYLIRGDGTPRKKKKPTTRAMRTPSEPPLL